MSMRLLPLVLLLAVTAPANGQARGPDPLVGCWEARRGERRVVERWERIPDGTLKGDSRTWMGDREVGGEQLVLARDSSGTWVYHADPDTQRPASFRATVLTDTLLVFENPRHDYPQRIGYRLRADSLIAWIETMIPGERRVNFPFARISCNNAP